MRKRRMLSRRIEEKLGGVYRAIEQIMVKDEACMFSPLQSSPLVHSII